MGGGACGSLTGRPKSDQSPGHRTVQRGGRRHVQDGQGHWHEGGCGRGNREQQGAHPEAQVLLTPRTRPLPPRRLSDTPRASCITVEAVIGPGRGQNYCCHWTPRPCPAPQGSTHAAAEAIVWTRWTPCPPQLQLLLLCVLPPNPSRRPNVKPHLTHPRSRKKVFNPRPPRKTPWLRPGHETGPEPRAGRATTGHRGNHALACPLAQ